jgi:K+-transporting ATPase KdpF subunit
MSADNVVGLIVGATLVVYILVALVFPERF